MTTAKNTEKVNTCPSLTFELFHDDEDPLGCLEHALEDDDAGMPQVLQDGHLVLQRGLLLRREPHLVDHLQGK